MLVTFSAGAQNTSGTDPDSSDPRANALLKQMVTALGGDKWTAIHSVMIEGKTSGFYNGKPNGSLGDFLLLRTMPVSRNDYGLQRVDFTKKRNVVNILTADKDWEVTYKGKRDVPSQEYGDVFRRRDHSLDAAVRVWWHEPGTILFATPQKMVDRHLVDEIAMLDDKNDNITLDLDTDTHLPVRVSFTWRDPLYRDQNEDGEEFADYHLVDGIMTPLNVTLTHNGDMTSQRYLIKVSYNVTIPPDTFDPDATALKIVR